MTIQELPNHPHSLLIVCLSWHPFPSPSFYLSSFEYHLDRIRHGIYHHQFRHILLIYIVSSFKYYSQSSSFLSYLSSTLFYLSLLSTYLPKNHIHGLYKFLIDCSFLSLRKLCFILSTWLIFACKSFLYLIFFSL